MVKAAGDKSLETQDNLDNDKDDEDQWMFRTFSKSKPKQREKSPPAEAQQER